MKTVLLKVMPIVKMEIICLELVLSLIQKITCSRNLKSQRMLPVHRARVSESLLLRHWLEDVWTMQPSSEDQSWMQSNFYGWTLHGEAETETERPAKVKTQRRSQLWSLD